MLPRLHAILTFSFGELLALLVCSPGLIAQETTPPPKSGEQVQDFDTAAVAAQALAEAVTPPDQDPYAIHPGDKIYVIPQDVAHSGATTAPETQSSPEGLYYVSPKKRSEFGISMSGLYIFDSADDLKNQTGWGGSLEAFGVLNEQRGTWYWRGSVEFAYFQTNGDYTYNGMTYHAEMERYALMFNAGAGVRFYDFDLSSGFGLGFGATHTRGTHHNDNGTAADLLLQFGARLTYSPFDNVSIFAGYRLMWNLPANGSDSCGYYDPWGVWYEYDCPCDRDKNKDKHDYPSVMTQMVEFGVIIRF